MNLCLLASLSLFYYMNVPVAEMKEMPSNDAQVVSQAYYSERVNILERDSDWTRIETVVDGYQGWVKGDRFFTGQEGFPRKNATFAKVSRPFVHLYDKPDTCYGPALTLPFDSLLEVVMQKDDRWIKVTRVDGKEGYIQAGDVVLNPVSIAISELPAFSLQFIGLPYTWGGRSGFGYDCSGFVQMLYRQAGIFIPRDSKDQANWEGFEKISVEELAPGDLVFFGPEESVVRHAGMYLGEGRFIHATVAENAPTIHISNLSDPDWDGSSLANRSYRIGCRFKKEGVGGFSS